MIMLAAVALLTACKEKSSSDELTRREASNADSAKIADTITTAPKLVKTAEMNFKVKNVQQVGEAVIALTKQYGGMVMHHQFQSSDGLTKDIHKSNDSVMRVSVFNTNADMIVKVPSENLEDFMTRVSHLGVYVKISKMDIEDRSIDYLSNKLKEKNHQEVLGLEETGKIKLKDPSALLSLRDDMVDKKLNNLRTDDAVRYSVVSLNFYQNNTILKEIAGNDDLSAYDIPLSEQLIHSFANGWAIFMQTLVAVANLWMFILVGLGIWLGVIYYKRKHKLINHPTA